MKKKTLGVLAGAAIGVGVLVTALPKAEKPTAKVTPEAPYPSACPSFKANLSVGGCER